MVSSGNIFFIKAARKKYSFEWLKERKNRQRKNLEINRKYIHTALLEFSTIFLVIGAREENFYDTIVKEERQIIKKYFSQYAFIIDLIARSSF
jgi:hypothetical protein